MWTPLLEEFERRGEAALAVDLPGYGMSDLRPGEPSLAAYAEAIGLACDGLDITRVDLVGHHTGCSVALKLAQLQPGRVGSLVLWGIGLVDGTFREQLAHEAQPVYDAEGTELLRYWTARRAASSPAVVDVVILRAVSELMSAGSNKADGHRAVGREDHVPLLAGLKHPLLGIAGGREMLLPHTKQAAELAPKGEFRDLGDYGMDVVDENAILVADTVLEFCGSHRE